MNLIEHLLTILAEEGTEIAKDCSKSLRFGLEEVNVEKPNGPNNRARLVAELNDLFAVVSLCVKAGIIPPNWWQEDMQKAKSAKVLKFLRYSRQLGTLDGVTDNPLGLWVKIQL